MQPSAVKSLVAALVRCFAIYLGLKALGFAIQGVSFLDGESHFLHPAYFAISTLLFAVVAFALWHWHTAVAGRLLPREMDELAFPEIKGTSFETGLISAVGLYVTVMALPQLIHHGAWLFSDPELFGARWVVVERAKFFGALVQFCLGVLLMLRAPGLRRLITKLRTGGT